MVKIPLIPVSAFAFLTQLKDQNNKSWFDANREHFKHEQDAIIVFAERLLGELNVHDVIETSSGKKSLYRIYRDLRFSKDKTPFSTYWG